MFKGFKFIHALVFSLIRHTRITTLTVLFLVPFVIFHNIFSRTNRKHILSFYRDDVSLGDSIKSCNEFLKDTLLNNESFKKNTQIN